MCWSIYLMDSIVFSISHSPHCFGMWWDWVYTWILKSNVEEFSKKIVSILRVSKSTFGRKVNKSEALLISWQMPHISLLIFKKNFRIVEQNIRAGAIMPTPAITTQTISTQFSPANNPDNNNPDFNINSNNIKM